MQRSFGRKPRQRYSLRLAETLRVCTTCISGSSRLQLVVLPIADPANVVAARRPLEDKKPTADAGKQLHSIASSAPRGLVVLFRKNIELSSDVAKPETESAASVLRIQPVL